MVKYEIQASVLAADFAHLASEVDRALAAGVDALHLDVMDGHFVRNLSMGPDIVAAVNRVTDAHLNVHLMIYSPYDYIERFVQAGADLITVHFEATEDLEETLDYIAKCNVKVGLALCPDTSAELALKYIDQIDLALVMTVHPGFGGQSFMPEMLDKIKLIRDMASDPAVRDAKKEPLVIQVDGGINAKTAALCAEAGANNFVAGTYLFESTDMADRVAAMRLAS